MAQGEHLVALKLFSVMLCCVFTFVWLIKEGIKHEFVFYDQKKNLPNKTWNKLVIIPLKIMFNNNCINSSSTIIISHIFI